MYDTSFVCTYELVDLEDAQKLYQIQLLQAFSLEDWDDKQIGLCVDKLYESMKHLQELISIINKIRQNPQFTSIIYFAGNDDSVIFRLLFSFEWFRDFHKCICEFTHKGYITKESYKILFNKL